MAAEPKRVKQVYLAVCDSPPEDRAAALDRECAGDVELRQRVTALIAAREASGGLFAESPSQLELPSEPFTNKAGDVIAGRYALTELIGEGGMGEVWVARQTEPVTRDVAIKLIKAGMDSKVILKRFEAERQALALMQHPNIAQVHDGGMTIHQRPFFVMELVKGPPLNVFCDERRLSIRQRLALFVDVCQAVQHAHQKGIVHRDLKPANILIATVDGRPVPKIIDFGVAKAVGSTLAEQPLDTLPGLVVGTLEYMSPEQAGPNAQDIDTRSDIYSLGVILYELLTGLRPIDADRLRQAALIEMIHIIQSTEPSKPSTRISTSESSPSLAAVRQSDPKKLTALLRGELDWVVMKCLEKDRERRYQSSSGLARELERFLANEPVEARPPSARYRIAKFIRRNRGFVSAAAVMFLLLVGGMVGTTIGLVRAEKNRKAEVRQRSRAQMIADFMTMTLMGAGPAVAKGRDSALLKDLMDDAARRIAAGQLGNDPDAECEMRRTIGNVYESLGESEPAIEHLRQSLRLATEQFGIESANADAISLDLAQALIHFGGFEETRTITELVIAHAESRNDDETLATAFYLNGQAEYNRTGGALDNAEKLSRQALAIRRRICPPDSSSIAQSLISIALMLHAAGKDRDAETLYREAWDIRRNVHGRLHPETISAACNLCDSLSQQHRDAEAEEILHPVLNDAEALFGPVHRGVADVLWRLGNAKWSVGDARSALPFHEHCLDIRQRVYKSPHRDIASAMVAVGRDKARLGDFPAAESLLKDALEMRRKVFPDHSAAIAASWEDLGNLKRDMNQLADSDRAFGEALAIWSDIRPDSLAVATVSVQLAVVKERLNELDRAIELYRAGVELRGKHLGTEHIDVADTMSKLGGALFRKGRKNEAESTLTQAVKIAQQSAGLANIKTLSCVDNLTFILEDGGKLAEAEARFRDSLKGHRTVYGNEHVLVANLLARLGTNLIKQQRSADAEPIWRECVTIREKLEPTRWSTYSAKSVLGSTLTDKGDFPQAEVQLLAAYDGLIKYKAQIPAPQRIAVRKCAERLMQLYHAVGSTDSADKWKSIMQSYDEKETR